jgi:hypothetical protein
VLERELISVFSDDGITDDDLRAGKYEAGCHGFWSRI